MADLDTPTGKARALGFLALAQVIFFKILGAVKALYDRSSPWRLLIDPRKFSCPEGLGDALNRFRRNANDFGYNYAFLCVVASILCVITSPFSVFIIAALTMAWGYVMYVRASDFHFNGYVFNLRAQGVLTFLASFLVLVVFTDVSSTLIQTWTGGVFTCVAHACVRNPEPRAMNDVGGDGGEGGGGGGVVGGFTDFVAESGRSLGGAFGKIGELMPTRWSREMDKMGINL